MGEKNILFIEEGYRRSSAAIEQARQLGFTVTLLGTQEPRYCTQFVSKFIQVDTYDLTAVKEAAGYLDKEIPISGVVTMMERLPAVAAVSKSLGLPGLSPEAAELAQHKFLMRKSLYQHRIPQPSFLPTDLDAASSRTGEFAAQIGFPMVVKPVGGAGGGGVFIAEDQNDLKEALAALRRMQSVEKKTFGYFPGEIIIESYMAGDQFSVEAYCQRSSVVVVGVTEKTVVEGSVEYIHLVPARLTPAELGEVRALTASAIRAMGIDDSMIHLEIVRTCSGFRIIEMNARLGGGCIGTHLIPIVYGVSMVGIMCQVACGEEVHAVTAEARGYAVATFVRGSSAGEVASIRGIEEALRMPGVRAIVGESAIHRIQRSEERASDDRLCAIVTSDPNPERALEIGQKASAEIQVEIAR